MKNRSFITKFNTKGSELTRMHPHSLPQRQSFMGKKLCYMYGRITMVLFILSFSTVIRHSMQTYSQLLQYVHENLLRKHQTLFNRRNIVLLHENARSHSARIMQEKNIGFWMICSTPSIIYTRLCIKYFSSFLFSTKCSE